MKYLLLLIFLLSPVLMQDDRTPIEEAEYEILVQSKAIENSKREIAQLQKRLNATILMQQNYTDILQQETAKNEELKTNISQLQLDFETCKNELELCKNRNQKLIDAKSKLNELKNEKERLVPEIEKCQKILENCNSAVPESSQLGGSTCLLSNLIDYKSSFIYNLLSGILGLDGKKS